jgi:hypothetical protein
VPPSGGDPAIVPNITRRAKSPRVSDTSFV